MVHDENGESPSFISLMSIEVISDVNDGYKYKESYATAFEVLAMLTNFLLIICTGIFWVVQMRYVHFLDEKSITDSDFAVMFFNLPLEITKADLHKLIVEAQVDPANIVYTNKCFDFKHVLKLKKKQFYWLKKIKYLEAYRKRFEGKVPENELNNVYPPRSILSWPPCKKFPREATIIQNLELLCSKLSQDKYKEVHYCGNTIVVLNNQRDPEKLISHYKKKGFLSMFKLDKIYAIRCPEPNNIIWENLSFKALHKRIVTVVIYLI